MVSSGKIWPAVSVKQLLCSTMFTTLYRQYNIPNIQKVRTVNNGQESEISLILINKSPIDLEPDIKIINSDVQMQLCQG